jgi:hypothetical protein
LLEGDGTVGQFIGGDEGRFFLYEEFVSHVGPEEVVIDVSSFFDSEDGGNGGVNDVKELRREGDAHGG